MNVTIINNDTDNSAGTMSLMAKIAEHLNVNINEFCGGGQFHGEHTSARTPEGTAGAEALGLNPDFVTTCVFHRNYDDKRIGFVQYTYFITFDSNRRAAIVKRDQLSYARSQRTPEGMDRARKARWAGKELLPCNCHTTTDKHPRSCPVGERQYQAGRRQQKGTIGQ